VLLLAEVLGKTLYLSVDPYMRIFAAKLPQGSTMIGEAVGRCTVHYSYKETDSLPRL
jgi:NADPH-dependent curcumin reductase CurA